MRRKTNVISPVDSVNTVQEMLVGTDYSVEDGETVWVRSTLQLFLYRINSGLVPNGTTIIQPAYGIGLWVLTNLTLGGGGGGPPSGAAGGDLSGLYPNPTVARINGSTVPAGGSLTIGNILQVTGVAALGYAPVNLAGGANFVTGNLPVANLAPGSNGQFLQTAGGVTVWGAPPSPAGAAGGDLSGTYPNPTVAKINGSTVPAGGALTPGNVLQVTGVAALGYAPINLAGGANFVTGVLPVSNLPSLAGDVTGNITTNTVVKINGATVPAAGALTVGNVLQVTGVAALGYAAVNLAGGANFVTGNLPITNIAPGSNGQVLITAGGVTTWGANPGGPPSGAAGGDLSGTYPNPTVAKINGSTVPAGGALTTGNVLQVTGVAALGYAAINLAGGANFVTGVLPVGNLPSLAGDVTGAINSNTVVKIHGATVPVAGALTTGNVLQVTGVAALGYAAINLAGGANFVTGALPAANLAPGSNGQVLVTAAGNTTWAQILDANVAPTANIAGSKIANATTLATGVIQLGGDLAGTGTAPTVAKINGATVPAAGALTPGNVLQVTSASALGYAAVNLAGGANFVTGNLPITNIAPGSNGQVLITAGGVTTWGSSPGGPPSGAAGGDLSGTYPNPTVAKINGSTVPAGGALTTGNVLQVTGVAALGYAAINLAGGANFVTGVLPVGNLPSLAGDVTGAINSNKVVALTGTGSPGLVQIGAQLLITLSGVASPKIGQSAVSGTNATDYTVEAQGVASGTGTGGYLLLGGGQKSGGAANGGVRLYMSGAPTTAALVELSEVVTGNLVLSLLKGSPLFPAQMGIGTGHRVAYVADAGTVPVSPPANGAIFLSGSGKLQTMGTDGVLVTL